MKKKLSVIMAVLLMLLGMIGCKPDLPDDNEAQTSGEDDGMTEIRSDQLAAFAVIRPSTAGSELIEETKTFVSELNRLHKTQIKPKDDFLMPGSEPATYEILIGDAERDEVKTFLASCRARDWGYGIVGTKLIIAGKNEAGTLKALRMFSKKYLTEADTIFFRAQDAVYTAAVYELDSITLNGSELKEYSIVYPRKNALSEKEAGEMLQEYLLEVYGYTLPLVSDHEFSAEKAIFLGKTAQITAGMQEARNALLAPGSEEKRVYLCGTEAQVWIDAEDQNGISAGVKHLTGKIVPVGGEKSCVVTVADGTADSYVGTAVSSMSFNVYYDADIAHMARVVKLIKTYMPDTIGFQEATPEWMEYLRRQLGNIYGDVGRGREAGNKGEHSAVFYKKSRFALIEDGTKWLSPNPEAEGSSFPGAGWQRIMTYALLEERESGERFMHINTHLGVEDDIRPKQLEVLKELIEKLPDVPFVVTGDFNWEDSASLNAKMGEIGCINSAKAAKKSDASLTYRGWENSSGTALLDYLFLSKRTANADSYHVCTEQVDGDWPSDHFPILVDWYTVK